MSFRVKDLILTLADGCVCEAEVPLDMAPEAAWDASVSLICPACGSSYARQEQVEDAVVASCPQCGCEFCPPMESIAKRVVRSVMESDRHRRHLLDIPSVRHKTHKRERQGGVGDSHKLAHKLLKQDV